jgi:hypothetical protein
MRLLFGVLACCLVVAFFGYVPKAYAASSATVTATVRIRQPRPNPALLGQLNILVAAGYLTALLFVNNPHPQLEIKVIGDVR